MDLKSKISKILNNLPKEKNSEFKNNDLAHSIKKGIKNNLSNDFLPDNYESHGSAGMGKWSIIPWIGIFDKDISTSPQEGFDIVYLFSINSNFVYLSLNQGWTFYKDKYKTKIAKENIQKVAKHLISELSIPSTKMTSIPINLLEGQKITSTDLPRGYELSNILSIKYDKNNLPSNDVMLTDLHDMMNALEQIKNQLIFPNFVDNIEHFISQNDSDSVDKSLNNQAFKISDSAITNNTKFIGKKINYSSRNEKNSDTGLMGENVVMDFEKHKLSNYPKLLKKIVHTSKEVGDGTGYDIKSFQIDGKPLYIEIKTTTASSNTSFFVTSNELRASKYYQENYILFRIYNFNSDTTIDNLEYFILKGPLENNSKIELVPSQFTAKIKK